MERKRQQHILILLALFLLSLLTISWFSDGKLFFGHDATFPLDSQFYTAKNLFVWDYQFSLGQFNYRAMQFLFPYYLFWAGLTYAGLSLVYVECLWVIFLFTLTGFSMFYLSSTLFKNQAACVGPFVASVAYMFNLYTLSMWRFGQTTTLIAYAVAPLFLALFINGLNSKKYLKYALSIGLCSVIFSAGFTGFPYVVSLFIIPSLLYSLYHILTNGLKSVKGVRKFLKVLIPLVIVANLFWIVPFLVSLFSFTNLLPSYGTTSLSYYDFINPVPFYKIIQGAGMYAMHLKIGEYSCVPFAASYSEFPLVFVSFTIIILAFVGFITKTKHITKEPLNLYFGILTLIGLFLSTGGNAPTGEVYKWMYLNLPGFWIFRSPYPDFAGLYVMGLALLIGLLALKLSSYSVKCPNWRRYLKYGAVLGVIVLLLSNAYPLVNGDIKKGGAGFPNEQVAFPPLSVTVPSFYSDAGEWINNQQGDFNVFLLPYRNYLAYSWGYAGSEIIQYYVHKSIITGQAGPVGNVYSSSLINQVYNSLGSDSFGKMLAFINVKYIWFSRDLRTYGGLQNSSDVEQIENQLRNQEGIELVNVFGDVAVYENTYWVSNKVYVPSSYCVASSIIDVLGFGYIYQSNESVVFARDQPDFRQLENILENNGIQWNQDININVYSGETNAFDWASLNGNETFAARSYEGWKAVVRTDGLENQSTLSFSDIQQCPYTFPSFSIGSWNSLHSTLIFVNAKDKPVEISALVADGSPVAKSDINVFWQTGWMGMTTSPIQFPIVIPAHQKGIVQLNNIVAGKVDLIMNNTSGNHGDSNNILVTFSEMDPTKYTVQVTNATHPFFLVFSESFDRGWVANVDGQQIAEECHFMANGYANSWFINKTGTFTVVLEFWPQKLFYVSAAISITTLVLCVMYFGKNKIKHIYQKHIQKNLTLTALSVWFSWHLT